MNLAQKCDLLEAENARLNEMVDDIREVAASQAARIAELEAALVPFAEAADAAESMRVVKGASDEARYGIRMGDLRKARAALEKKEAEWMACPECGEESLLLPMAGESGRLLPVLIGEQPVSQTKEG